MACIFCDFVSGEQKRNMNGYLFKPLHETKSSLSFLSIDFPATEKGHILVIPKKHYKNLEEVPSIILKDLMQEVQLVSSILRKTHAGTNILVNNGEAAGQQVMHLHFHVIPRNPKDGMDFEHFERKELTLQQYGILYRKLKKEFN
ncbi:MAG: HIT family protein [Nanoarchaeota archaeon]|nr:HIT family protein [Nanoarchaeota archaeon]